MRKKKRFCLYNFLIRFRGKVKNPQIIRHNGINSTTNFSIVSLYPKRVFTEKCRISRQTKLSSRLRRSTWHQSILNTRQISPNQNFQHCFGLPSINCHRFEARRRTSQLKLPLLMIMRFLNRILSRI